MANRTAFTGQCIPPFLDASLFPDEGGFVAGRFCAPIDVLDGNPTCCLPCPAPNWTYPDSFNTYSKAAEWLNVLGLVLLVFMLVSYIALPAQKTRSHYLSVCLIVSVAFIALGFTIPLAAEPDQCYNEITPNDMYSSTECAWSGACIIAGGLGTTMWIFIRALSMNLQICWDIVPGRKFFYASQALGWGIPAVLLATTMTVTGVSFRFGSACHVNHAKSMADFWGPLLGIAGAAGILQLVTFGYCIHVYLKNLWSDQADVSTNASGSALPSYSGSVHTQTARAVYRRLKKVLWLQWRGICIVSIILVDVTFFCIVFVSLDGEQHSIVSDWERVEPWLICLALHPTDKDACVAQASSWIVSEPTVVAVLLLLALAGLQVFLFLSRPSIFQAWAEFVRNKCHPHRQEFVSLDARQQQPDVAAYRSNSQSKHELLKYDHIRGHQQTTFEMQQPIVLKHLDMGYDSKSPATILSSPSETYCSPLQRLGSPDTYVEGQRWTSASPIPSITPTQQHHQQDYFHHHNQRPSSPPERNYHPHHASFSYPSRQSSTRSVTFVETHPRARGGLGLNPPSEVSEDLSLERDQSLDRR